MNKTQREIQRKLRILRYAEEIGQVAKACRYFGIGRSSFYRWRQAWAERGEAGLINAPPIPEWHAKRTPPEREKRFSVFAANTTSAQCGSFGIWSAVSVPKRSSNAKIQSIGLGESTSSFPIRRFENQNNKSALPDQPNTGNGDFNYWVCSWQA